jgi:hypothetical protein
MVINIDAERVLDDEDHGIGLVTFSDWEGINEYEKLAAKVFEEGLENTLQNRPPSLFFYPNDNCDDMIVDVWFPALGDGDCGPLWRFRMKQTFKDIGRDYSEEDQADILKAMEAVTEYVRSRIKKA